MVLTSGFEPLLTDPQSVVLTTNTKLEWCLGTESNRRHAGLQPAALPTELPRHGDPGRIRTPNLLVRSQMLCPVELRSRFW